MSTLNEFHRLNFQRMEEAFPPAHSLAALVVCVQEEVGELASAVLGITGEKKRKVHLTIDDILDAVADTLTYLSLVASRVSFLDFKYLWIKAKKEYDAVQDIKDMLSESLPKLSLLNIVLRLQGKVGKLATLVANLPLAEERTNLPVNADVLDVVADTITYLSLVAGSVGCTDLETLLFVTFDKVSDRAGWNGPRLTK